MQLTWDINRLLAEQILRERKLGPEIRANQLRHSATRTCRRHTRSKAIDRMNNIWQRTLPVKRASEAVPEPLAVTAASQSPSLDSSALAQIL